ncbi:hypothetical protein G6F56_002997 [Rhizopus delemar]|nr:hypothetical protein G6F56_002997 [Rhizopus delemar]
MGNNPSKILYKRKHEDTFSEPSYGSRRSSVSDYFVKKSQSLASLLQKEEEAKEADRHQREHYMLKIIRKGNIATVLDSPSVIIQSGIEGNGIWALDMATQYPKAKVIGLDLKLPDIQLSNQTFYRAHILRPWPLNECSADFVFQRFMNQRIEKDQWEVVLKEMFRVLKRGGQLELVEAELLNHRGGPALNRLQSFYGDYCIKNNLNLDFATMTQTLKQLGFEEVSQSTFDIPLGEWPEDAESSQELRNFGFMNLEIRKAHVKNRKSEFLASWGICPETYDSMTNQAVRETEEYKTFSRYNCWVARKPL